MRETETDRDRDRDRHTQRHTQRHTHTERDTHTETETERQRQRERKRGSASEAPSITLKQAITGAIKSTALSEPFQLTSLKKKGKLYQVRQSIFFPPRTEFQE